MHSAVSSSVERSSTFGSSGNIERNIWDASGIKTNSSNFDKKTGIITAENNNNKIKTIRNSLYSLSSIQGSSLNNELRDNYEEKQYNQNFNKSDSSPKIITVKGLTSLQNQKQGFYLENFLN